MIAHVELRKALCRNDEVHEAHGFWTTGYANWLECPGWSQREADTTALITRLLEVRREYGDALPDGIALECYPGVPYCIAAAIIPGYMEFTGERDPRSPVPGIPVIACMGMERGAWRIRHFAGTIAEGGIRETA